MLLMGQHTRVAFPFLPLPLPLQPSPSELVLLGLAILEQISYFTSATILKCYISPRERGFNSI